LLQGLPIKEISDRLGVSERSVYRANEALERLAEELLRQSPSGEE
jgi:transposase